MFIFYIDCNSVNSRAMFVNPWHWRQNEHRTTPEEQGVACNYLCNFVAHGYMKIRSHCSRVRKLAPALHVPNWAMLTVSAFFKFRYTSGRSLILIKPVFLEAILKNSYLCMKGLMWQTVSQSLYSIVLDTQSVSFNKNPAKIVCCIALLTIL